jgi:CheY-like chemotaxis protein
MEYRILIVDEDPAARRRFAEALIAFPPAVGVSYKISTTGSAAAAQLQATRQPFHLLLATIRSGGDGLGLASRLQKLDTKLQLLLFHDGALAPANLRAAEALGAKLSIHTIEGEDLCIMVAERLGLRRSPAPQPPPETHERPPATLADVQLLLDVTRRQARAQLGIYTDNIGNMLAQVGDGTGLEVASLTSLIAGSFVNSMEMGRVLRDPETSHLSVHEGAHYDLYSTNVGGTRLIALVFEKQIVQPKLGMVWLLMKRASEQLRRMHVVEKSVDEVFSETLSNSLNNEFDRLFGGELDQVA